MPVLVVLVGERVLAPVVEPRRRAADRDVQHAAAPRRGGVEELGCRGHRPRLAEPAPVAVVRDEERERLSDRLRVGLPDQLFDVVERRPKSFATRSLVEPASAARRNAIADAAAASSGRTKTKVVSRSASGSAPAVSVRRYGGVETSVRSAWLFRSR